MNEVIKINTHNNLFKAEVYLSHNTGIYDYGCLEIRTIFTLNGKEHTSLELINVLGMKDSSEAIDLIKNFIIRNIGFMISQEITREIVIEDSKISNIFSKIRRKYMRNNVI